MLELRQLLSGPHRILFHGRSDFQEVLLLESREVRLYLDGQLQFSSVDEGWYHEALVHPAMALAPRRRRVLVLGGGDGLAVREILRYPDVESVDLVDIDPLVLRMARRHRALARLNRGALRDPRVRVWTEDARVYLSVTRTPYDVMVADFPDPADEGIAQLYTREFFARAAGNLAEQGVLVLQSASPEGAPRAYWTVGRTLEAAGLHTLSYHVEVPSFGDWGFHAAATFPLAAAGLRFAVPTTILPADPAPLFAFPPRVLEARAGTGVNTLSSPVLCQLYQSELGPSEMR